ncbi:acyltransferase [Methanosphaerula subterraneus]|uniref:acyltransferase n=1 Tax=Methanosphaerula subterraneus TaxID=3350244 RepID=UPI003F84187F
MKNGLTVQKVYKKIIRALSKSPFISSNFRIYLLKLLGVKIGEGVVINEGFTLACDIGYESNLTIEDRVAFGPNVTIVLTAHPNNSILRRYKEKYPFLEVFGKVRIMHDSWIGAGVIILPDVTLKQYSIIGAGAVVTKEVSPFCVVAGVPARLIKRIEIPEDAE